MPTLSSHRTAYANTTGSTASKRPRFRIRHFIFCAAAIVLMFSNDEANAITFQVLGVSLFILSAIMFLANSADRRLTLAPIDIILLLSVPVSYLASTLLLDIYSLIHTTIFLFTYLSVVIIAQRASEDELLMCVRVSTIAILMMVVVIFGQTMITSLMPGATKRWELREAPFEMHPNLAGFVYGGFIVMAASSGFSASRRSQFATIGIIILCFAILTVASARGGLVAVLLTFAVYVAANIFRGTRFIYFVSLGLVVAALASIYWDNISAYAIEMFDLETEQRGFSSGGTGRFEIWARGIDYIFGRSWEILIGSGLRSTNQMEFPVESSYISLMVDSGIFLSAGILIAFVQILMRCYSYQVRGSAFHRFAFYTLLFAMFQSIFNRYLIAIGNPVSLLVLLVASKASSRLELIGASSAPPRRAGRRSSRKASISIHPGRPLRKSPDSY